MIDDIVFDVTEFLLELPTPAAGGIISSYSLNGDDYDFTESSGGETSSIFIS